MEYIYAGGLIVAIGVLLIAFGARIENQRRFTVTGNDFFESSINKTELPIEFGEGNIIWPQGWTKEQADAWRKSH